MSQNRIYFAVEQVGIAPDGSNTFTAVHGAQNLGFDTQFNLQPILQIGQLEIYDNIEGVPDVSVTIEKVLDGYPGVYLLATQGAASASLAGRSNAKAIIGVSYFPDTNDSANGAPLTQVSMSGMVISSLQYNFNTDGALTESTTLVGNNKVWRVAAPFTFSGQFTTNADVPVAIAGSGGVNQRQHVLFTPTVGTLDTNGQVSDPDCTILPRGLPGISSSGTNDKDSNGYYLCKVQSINVSTDLGRDQILNLGAKAPYFRYVQFPVDVTTDIEVISLSGDLVSATEQGVFAGNTNLQKESIRVAVKEGTRLNLGTNNKLSGVTVGGGGTDGANQTLTFSYRNQNSLTVTHWADPTVALRVAQGGVDN